MPFTSIRYGKSAANVADVMATHMPANDNELVTRWNWAHSYPIYAKLSLSENGERDGRTGRRASDGGIDR